MSFIKIGQLVIDLAQVRVIDLHRMIPPELKDVVSLQLDNRSINLSVEESEKFRWWIRVAGPTAGILDLDARYEDREAIEAGMERVRLDAIAKFEAQQAAEAGMAGVSKPRPKLVVMPRATSEEGKE